jgi:hypothetical protein
LVIRRLSYNKDVISPKQANKGQEKTDKIHDRRGKNVL